MSPTPRSSPEELSIKEQLVGECRAMAKNALAPGLKIAPSLLRLVVEAEAQVTRDARPGGGGGGDALINARAGAGPCRRGRLGA